MIYCTVDVTGNREKIVNVWMKFARKCVNAGLKAKVFPIVED